MIRVILPFHLRTLAHVGTEVTLEVEGPVTPRRDAGREHYHEKQARYSMLARSHPRPRHPTAPRFSCGRACASSFANKTSPTTQPDAPLPDAVASGKEPFIVIGAIAGG
jgi:sulfur-carrier protein